MNIPITGILLLPLGLIIALLPWRYCLTGLAVFAMMSPAAVVNIGSFGLQPGYYLSILLIGRTALEVMADGFRLNAFVLARLRPLFLFVVVCVVVLSVALSLFQGTIDTLPGTSGFKSDATQPFYLGRENFTQIAYLVLNLGLLCALGQQAARQRFSELLKACDFAVMAGLIFSATVCVWQFASLYGGLPFPSDFFYSNAGYGRADSQSMAGLFRINGPFEEPATVGYVFTGYLFFAWLRYRLYPTALSSIMIAACVFSMLVSTSTTAFLGLFVFACVVAWDVAAARIHFFTRRYSSGQVAIVGIILVAAVLGGLVIAIYGREISYILQSTIFDKSESTSFQQRSFADQLAMRIFVDTYGIGIGLGSHKANSLVLTLLSNTGIAGLLLFGTFLCSLLRRVTQEGTREAGNSLRRSIAPFRWGLIGLVLIHVLSNPNLSTLALWVQMGAILSLQVALRMGETALDGPLARDAASRAGLAIPYARAGDQEHRLKS